MSTEEGVVGAGEDVEGVGFFESFVAGGGLFAVAGGVLVGESSRVSAGRLSK
jgi:hypothetical protein